MVATLLVGALYLGYAAIVALPLLAATPLAISLLTFWPVRIAVYGQDLFRTGGDDYGRGDAIFGGVYLSIVAWSVVPEPAK